MIITHVGSYQIGQDISKVKSVEEYDENRYEDFAAAGAPRTFQDEQIYDGGHVVFAGLDDWTITIATIKGIIYKFGLVHMAVWKSMTNKDYAATRAYLLGVLQQPTRKSVFSKEIIWQQPEGGVSLNIRSALLPGATKKVTGVVVDITSANVMRKFDLIPK